MLKDRYRTVLRMRGIIYRGYLNGTGRRIKPVTSVDHLPWLEHNGRGTHSGKGSSGDLMNDRKSR